MNFIMACIGVLCLIILDCLKDLISTLFQYLINCINVGIYKKSLKIAEYEVKIHNVSDIEPNVIGFQAPDEYDYYEDDDCDEDCVRTKNKIGF